MISAKYKTSVYVLKNSIINEDEKIMFLIQCNEISFLKTCSHMTEYFNASENPIAVQVFFDIVEHQWESQKNFKA